VGFILAQHHHKLNLGRTKVQDAEPAARRRAGMRIGSRVRNSLGHASSVLGDAHLAKVYF
jgi:hypothetical protein